MLIEHWHIVVLVPLLCVAATLTYTLLRDPVYTAATSFMPEVETGSGAPPALAGIATQLGLNAPGAPSESPDFYANLARSPSLMTNLLYEGVTTRDGTRHRTLLDFLEVEAPDSARRLERGLAKLSRMMATAVNRETSVVNLQILSEDPVVSAALANSVVQDINDFNLGQRQSRARSKQAFISHRLEAAELELRTAESSVRAFLEANRSWQASPQLTFEKDRLEREVMIKQEVYLTLSREAESVGIEAVNDTPVITVVDVATPPATQSAPRPLRSSFVAFVGGVGLALVLVTVTTYLRSLLNPADPEVQALQRSASSARDSVRRSLGLRSSE
jgi:uncharacterized protein involved in exopolysaccharide biosynthesis